MDNHSIIDEQQQSQAEAPVVVISALGVDIGTTSIKVCILDSSGQIINQQSVVHAAWIDANKSGGIREQNAELVIRKALDLIQSLDLSDTDPIVVCVTGQMHGLVFWNSADICSGVINCSSLITWMDARVPQQFIDDLPSWECGKLHAGYGMVTLAWLHKNGLINQHWDCCGTIMDLFNNYLIGKSGASIGIQNAFSWGYCDFDGRWTIPLLPRIVSSGTVVGSVGRRDVGIPFGSKVFASLGDLQSTVYPLLDARSGVLNLGTSAQLCFACQADTSPCPSRSLVPFFDAMKLSVAASMNGGNAVELLAKKIIEWASALSGTSELKLSYECLEDACNLPTNLSSNLSVKPMFFTEREGNIQSSIVAIDNHTTVQDLFQATVSGLVANLFRMLPSDCLIANGIDQLKLAGNANKEHFKREIARHCDDRIKLIALGDQCQVLAAYGAALHALEREKMFVKT